MQDTSSTPVAPDDLAAALARSEKARLRLAEELASCNRELTEVLEQQTATSRVLEVISSSPADVQPVFDLIAERAVRLCSGEFCAVFRYDDRLLDFVSHFGLTAEDEAHWKSIFPQPPSNANAVGRAIMTLRPSQISNVETEPGFTYVGLARTIGFRSVLGVPMIKDGRALGGIVVARKITGSFPANQVELLKTFADQAVIAIENVRLFRELEGRTRDLGRTVEQLTALGEVGRAVGSSLDFDTVLATIVEQAVRLSDCFSGIIYEFDESAQRFFARSTYRISPEHLAILKASPIRLGEGAVGLAGTSREPVQSVDIAGGDYPVAPQVRELLLSEGLHAVLAVPLVREERLLGGLVTVRRTPGAFPDDVIELLKTFAAHSALALQNARLYRELEEKSRELEIASEHKSRFVANMSHELRTPLNAIIGYSEMLEEEAEDLGQADFLPDLKKIQVAGKHLLGLINEILDLSKIEAGKMELFLERFDVADLVSEVAATVRPLVEKNANSLEIECPRDIGTMHADLTKVRQVLFNLLSNAGKFTREGTIRLGVSARAANGEPRIVFRVADSGIGLTAEQKGRLFEAFTQADTSTTREYGGTGLGLALSRTFCRMMGGDITVESEPGAGSCFTVELPVEVGAEAPAPRPAHDAPPARPVVPADRPAVLVIDDDAAVRELIRRHLDREGLAVVEAAGGADGLRLARETRPAAITLDVMMPGMDGWSVLAALKADPELASIPVVMVTMVDDRNAGFGLGATDYLTKPIDWRRLAQVMARLTGGRPAARVLVVEDDEGTRELLRARLVNEGCRVVEAANGRIALERLAAEDVDIVLLDLMMPEMDGFEVIEHLRASERWRTLPVFVITARDLDAVDRRRLNGYVEAVLAKGARPAGELLGEIARLVRARAPSHS